MTKAIDFFYKILGAILVFLLAGMAIMVFVNVILRYAANSGLTVSEELARYFSSGCLFLEPSSPFARIAIWASSRSLLALDGKGALPAWQSVI